MFLKHLSRLSVLIALSVTVGFLLAQYRPSAQSAQTALFVTGPPEPDVKRDAFGLVLDGFEREERQVKRGESFSDVLADFGIEHARILGVAEAVAPALDVRRLRPGDRFIAYRSGGEATHLVYQPNPVDYVVVQLRGDVRLREGRRPVTSVRKTVVGTIEGSFYGSMVRSGADAALVDRLTDIYAWQIDFHRAQKGDAFRVIYEEQYVDGVFYGVGDVIAANLEHADRPYYAFRYEQDGRPDYYDEDGNSLRKALLKSPLKYSRITSRYTMRRYHPVQKRYKPHLGTDYAAPTGTPILSVGDGEVVDARYKRSNGNYVTIRHNGTYTTGYLHMSKIARGVRAGVRVRQGDVIGYVGSTGLATGPHVCYRFWKNGMQVDPLNEDLPSSNPVTAEQRDDFQRVRDGLLALMDRTTAPDLDLAHDVSVSAGRHEAKM